MKWILAAIGLALAGWFGWFQLNTTKVSYVNGLAPYDVMPGREYILEHDCYVFAWREDPTAGFPLLGARIRGARTSVDALPQDSSTSYRGRALEKVRILDLIPRGTRLLITSVRREESRRAGTVISYEARLLDDVDRPYQKVDLRPILLPVARGGDVPAVDPAVAVPWIKR
jgi:hypothetical protein